MNRKKSKINEDLSLILKRLENDKDLQDMLEQVESLEAHLEPAAEEESYFALRLPYAGAEPISEPVWK